MSAPAATAPRPPKDTADAFGEHLAALNVRRVIRFMLVSIAVTLLAAAASALGWLPMPRSVELGLGLDAAAALATFAAAIFLDRRVASVPARRAFVFLTLVALLGVMDFYFFALLPVFGKTSTYAIGVVCAGVLFVLPPRRLFPLLAANHVLFLWLVLRSAQPRPAQFIAAADATVGLAVAGLAAWLIHAAKRADFERERALAAANAALRERHAEMNELMAVAAHDLRSPLQGVKHLVEWTDTQPGLDSARRSAALREIARTCSAMLRLVSRLLDAHSAETTPLAGRLAAGDVLPVAREALHRAEILAAPRRVACELRAPAAAVALHDAASLQQVLDNLLANAVKFSPATGRVLLEIGSAGGICTLAVHDEGPGVPPAERPRLFHKFHRGSARPASGETGSGLGLFIVHALTEAMGGTVRFDVRSPHGASFTVALPSSTKSA